MYKHLTALLKEYLRTEYLPYAILAAGCLGALLRFLLFATGLDSKGLLVSGHAAQILLWILTAGVAVLLLYWTKDLKQAPKYSFNFPPSLFGALGSAAAAVGLLIMSINLMRSSSDDLSVFAGILCLLSAAALGFLANCRFKGLHPSALFPMIICAFLMANLVCMYRQWSGNPQMEEYVFCLLASVCSMLACYYSASFAANAGNRQLHTLTHLGAVYFCLLSLPRCEFPIFYISMILWLFTDLCDLTPMPHKTR